LTRIYPIAIERSLRAIRGSGKLVWQRIKPVKNSVFSFYSIARPIYFISVKSTMITTPAVQPIAHGPTMFAAVFAVLKWPFFGQIGVIAFAVFPV
jgi:hypothetical protein